MSTPKKTIPFTTPSGSILQLDTQEAWDEFNSIYYHSDEMVENLENRIKSIQIKNGLPLTWEGKSRFISNKYDEKLKECRNEVYNYSFYRRNNSCISDNKYALKITKRMEIFWRLCSIINIPPIQNEIIIHLWSFLISVFKWTLIFIVSMISLVMISNRSLLYNLVINSSNVLLIGSMEFIMKNISVKILATMAVFYILKYLYEKRKKKYIP